MYESIPGSELCILPGCGHGPPFERAEIVDAVLLDFLARHPMNKADAGVG
jgi:pimeloyl-ACP methyl ester carboxylesterase